MRGCSSGRGSGRGGCSGRQRLHRVRERVSGARGVARVAPARGQERVQRRRRRARLNSAQDTQSAHMRMKRTTGSTRAAPRTVTAATDGDSTSGAGASTALSAARGGVCMCQRKRQSTSVACDAARRPPAGMRDSAAAPRACAADQAATAALIWRSAASGEGAGSSMRAVSGVQAWRRQWRGWRQQALQPARAAAE